MPTCTAAALVTGCFNTESWTPQDQLALIVYLMTQELKAVGGTDYTNTLTNVTTSGGLLYDAAQVFMKMTDDQRQEALINIYINNATSAGATTPATRPAAANAIACLANATPDQLAQAFLMLTCKLGKHTGS